MKERVATMMGPMVERVMFGTFMHLPEYCGDMLNV